MKNVMQKIRYFAHSYAGRMTKWKRDRPALVKLAGPVPPECHPNKEQPEQPTNEWVKGWRSFQPLGL